MQRLVYNEWSEEYRPTLARQDHFPSLLYGGTLIELRLVDLPSTPQVLFCRHTL